MALAAAIAEANREKAVTLPALGAERTSSSKPEKRLGDLVHSESMPRMLGEMRGLTRTESSASGLTASTKSIPTQIAMAAMKEDLRSNEDGMIKANDGELRELKDKVDALKAALQELEDEDFRLKNAKKEQRKERKEKDLAIEEMAEQDAQRLLNHARAELDAVLLAARRRQERLKTLSPAEAAAAKTTSTVNLVSRAIFAALLLAAATVVSPVISSMMSTGTS